VRPPREAVIATRPGSAPGPEPEPAPVEYAVAIDRYLAVASLGDASRRIYRISLISWAWALVGRRPPTGAERRGAVPPVVPLALLDGDEAGLRLADALRSAAGWWQEQGWITGNPTAGLRHLAGRAAPVPALTSGQVGELFRARTALREQALWRVIYDSGAHVDDVLGLDAGRLDLTGGGAPIGASPRGQHAWIRWQHGTGQLLGWLLAGRSFGPVFLTERRAPAGAPPADVCPVTGRARMSYRRAAEIFSAVTRPLDPQGRGWTLGQLRQTGLESGAGAG
jgi:integrase